jgi:hypothetical protein
VFYRDPQPSYTAGANTLEIASIGISAGLLENNRTGNTTRLWDAFHRIHSGVSPSGNLQELYNERIDASFSLLSKTKTTWMV